jgi:hypothetical protein
VIIFSLIWFLLKIIINQIFLKKKPKPNLNRFKPTGFGSVRFFEQKPIQTGLARFFSLARFWLDFFPVWLGLSSARFFRFQAYKTETKSVGFFKILICLFDFFSRFDFFGYFFLVSIFRVFCSSLSLMIGLAWKI